MTPEQIAAIAAREKAATQGPWVFDSSYSICDVQNRTMLKIPDDADEQYYLLNCLADCPEWYRESEANAKFSAHARADILDLLNEVERLTVENAELRKDAARIEWLAETCHGHGTAQKYRAGIDAATASRKEWAARRNVAMQSEAGAKP